MNGPGSPETLVEASHPRSPRAGRPHRTYVYGTPPRREYAIGTFSSEKRAYGVPSTGRCDYSVLSIAPSAMPCARAWTGIGKEAGAPLAVSPAYRVEAQRHERDIVIEGRSAECVELGEHFLAQPLDPVD